MKQSDVLDNFYKLLGELERKTGKMTLCECDNKVDWPEYGVYFFFEEGEFRENSREFRVVRAGSNAGDQSDNTSLWSHLRLHRGTIAGKYAGGGNHRVSFFRLHIGTSLINKEGIDCDSWGQGSSANARTRDKEHPLEMRVSEIINHMPFLWLKVNSAAQAEYIEKNTIALLNNFQKQAIDKPSAGWLGHYCNNSFVKKSGLWNVDYVENKYNPNFIHELEKLI